MREKGKRLIAIILSCLLLLSNVTVYAATEAEAQSDTQNTVSVNASEEAVTLPEEPTNGSAGEEAVIQNEPNAEDTSDETEETETLAPINETDPLEILETPKNMVGIEMSSFTFLQTTRSVGIPTVGSTATGTCYIGDTWNVNYPYQDYFHVNNFSAETDKLYLGKYVIKETKAPEGYLLNPKEFEVTLAYKDQTTEIVYGDVTVPNQPAKGQIEILKKDEETGNLLSGAEFTVTAAEDITTPDGTVRAEKGTVVDTIVTDTTGIARSKELYLGKYVVKETKQPIGFIRPNQTWDVELKYADQKTELVKENLTIKNQPTEIIIDKKETGTDKPLEGVKFVIWNKDKEDPIDPGMQHKEIYTTDANGKIRLLYLEPGNYAVAEVESIPGYAWDDKMIYEFTITEDGRVDGEVSHTIPVGNDRTEITETNAINVSTGTQDAFAVDLTIIDTVSIVNLMPNREYKLQLILADAKTGEPLKVKDQPSGDLLTTEKTFTADSSKMDVDMQIEFDASPFVGRTIVAYEYLYQDDVEISRHEDPNDKKQQIYVKDATYIWHISTAGFAEQNGRNAKLNGRITFDYYR